MNMLNTFAPFAVALGLSLLGSLDRTSPQGHVYTPDPPRPDPARAPEHFDFIIELLDELESQAAPGTGDRLFSELFVNMVRSSDTGSQIAIPSDLPGAPSSNKIREIATSLSAAFECPITINRGVVPSEDGGTYPVTLITAGDLPIDTSWVGKKEKFSGIIDTVVDTVIRSSVGTVTSMGVQSLVRSMGGERRLARTMKRYRAAMESGNEAAADRIRQKIIRRASRIKGRQVDWSEVEAIMQEARL